MDFPAPPKGVYFKHAFSASFLILLTFVTYLAEVYLIYILRRVGEDFLSGADNSRVKSSFQKSSLRFSLKAFNSEVRR